MDKPQAIQKVKKLYRIFHNGEIPTLEEHEVHPNLDIGSRERYLYFTLPPCLNYQRHSPAMWKSALETWNDKTTNYLFFPERVVKTKYEKVQKDLARHKLSLQKNKHTDIWTKISKTLHDFYEDDPREIFAESDHDVEKVLNVLRKEMKSQFPYLSGPKMSNYWLYILSQYTNIKLKNMHMISIIPDTHVLQSTVQLGLSSDKVTPEKAEELWHDLLKNEDISPVEMHPVLWNWSRNNFIPRV